MQPLRLEPRKNSSITTTGAVKGMNLESFPQLLNVEYCQKNENYQITADGRLVKRKGYVVRREFGGDPMTFYEAWDDWLTIRGHGSSLSIYDSRDQSDTLIKDDYRTEVINGVIYGDYAFIGASQDQLSRLERRIYISSLSGSISEGDSIIDDISSQILGEVLEYNAPNSYVVLGSPRATKPTVSNTIRIGSETATVDSYEYALVNITNAPSVDAIRLIEARLYIGSGSTLYYSEVDAGTNPPFTNWSVGTNADESGRIFYKKGGRINAVATLGDVVVAPQETGRLAVSQETIDSNNVLTKIDVIRLAEVSAGGSRAVAETNSGLVTVNNRGMFLTVSIGQDNVKFDDQEYEISELLGEDFFEDKNLDNADAYFDEGSNTVFITMGKQSTVNNYILTYNFRHRSIGEITGWAINRFLVIEGDLHGLSSTDGNLLRLFDGFSDDGIDIQTKYEQELKVGDLNTLKELNHIFVNGQLSSQSVLKIYFDIYDEDGKFIGHSLSFQMTSHLANSISKGYNEMGYNGAWGGSKGLTGLINTLADSRERIRNFYRLVMRVESYDTAPHVVNWVKLNTREKAVITRRRLLRNN